MERKLLVGACLLMPSLAFAGDLVDGQWTIKRDFTIDLRLDSTTRTYYYDIRSHGGVFSCQYLFLGDSGVCEGRTYFDPTRTTRVITWTQFGPNYFAVHSGRMVGTNRFVGTWYDVAGNAGDFELTKN